MKKIVFVGLLFFSSSSNAQKTVSDTLSYLKTIVAHKTIYIGKPFSILLADFKIQIKHFMPNTDIIHDITLSDNIRNNNRGLWNQSSKLLYSNSIIADIKIRE